MDSSVNSFDDSFDALAHTKRRNLLVALLDESSYSVLHDRQITVAPDDAAERHRVEMSHIHLPKLEAYGFIDWNRDANEVTRGPQFDEIRPLLELLVRHTDELPDGYL